MVLHSASAPLGSCMHTDGPHTHLFVSKFHPPPHSPASQTHVPWPSFRGKDAHKSAVGSVPRSQLKEEALGVGPGPVGQDILSLGIPYMSGRWKTRALGVHSSLVPLDSMPHGQWLGRNQSQSRIL